MRFAGGRPPCSIRLALATPVLVALAACTAPDSGAPASGDDGAGGGRRRTEFGAAGGVRVVGLARPPRVNSDQRPRHELFVERAAGGSRRPLDIVALDAAVDADTGTVAWVDTEGRLWTAPLANAPGRRREVATGVIVGLAARGGRVAFATRIRGPETAPFVLDLRAHEVTALDDGAGPDEILGFSPEGDEVLLLSGRSGLASLFAAGVDQTAARQLTNAGLSPGPGLDPETVVPAPVSRREVAWDRRGIAFRAAREVVWVKPDGSVTRLDGDASPAEVVR